MTLKKLMCQTDSYWFSVLSNQQLCIIKFELVWEGNMLPYFDFIDAIEKLKFILPSVQCPYDTKHILLSLFQNNVATHWNIFLASLSPTFTRNLAPYIKLPAYVRFSWWSVKSILMSVRQGFTDFTPIGR